MYTYIYMTRPSLNLVLWAMMHSNRWLGVRLELCGNLLISTAAAAAVGARLAGGIDHHHSALLGLSVTLALGITNELGWMVRQSTEAEANMCTHTPHTHTHTQVHTYIHTYMVHTGAAVDRGGGQHEQHRAH